MRRTKILATIGPATASPSGLRALLRAGADGFRINCSHGDDLGHREYVNRAKAAAAAEHRTVFLVADLQGPKMRLGALDPSPTVLLAGQTWRLDDRRRSGGADRAFADVPHLYDAARPGDPVLLGDGAVELRIDSVGPSGVVTRVITGGPIASHAGVYLPKARLRTDVLSPKDRSDLATVLDAGVDYVALSFVRSGADLAIAQRAARRLPGGKDVGWIAKIERREALDGIDGILERADAIMVARGDLGIEVPLERLALEQKRLVARARSARVPAIVATQMLLSMVSAARPTRAEATDVANAVLDGADALMLSEESAIGSHPSESVEWLDRIARVTESRGIPEVPEAVAGAPSVPMTHESAVASAALRLARDLGARMIVTPTHSGRTARMVAAGRPSMPIVALSSRPGVRRRLALVWGVVPHDVPDHLGLKSMREYAERDLADLEGIEGSGPIVVTAGYPVEGRPTNLLTIVEPPAGGRRRHR